MSVLRHPRREDGTEVDATFELIRVEIHEIIYHHKAGAVESPRSVNSDYHEGLQLLLSRLGSLNATLIGVRVDSSVAQEMPVEDRELDIVLPISLRPDDDFREVRLNLTRAQKSVARRSGAKPGGGNDQKRIRISFTLPGPRASARLAETLEGPDPAASE